ncbi:MAG: type II toxin-antitoxin system VapC family toxin [Deltaproteobacteria bacterium]|nr:type II toxin-antitoxin system VapC family toxin [Deltaproteobacteria bacterium]MBW1961699.1 type II toxin-antitoxin system VapC family toxin [Deltaproteobacteria bacterium]MBW1993464.1 type II toxin-antitoxin system VapC family toxin [Deltaproteobacteria bacterium]MBW2151017.1 type II toxin-antitoxin system VapC family toxin [Deltaproteobacteria bacterium]
MRFWDSSALVPLLVEETATRYCLQAIAGDREMLVWCLSRVEVISALCRKLRDGTLGDSEFQAAKKLLDAYLDRAYEVTAIERVKKRAARLLEVHLLRAADACQLAAALVACQEDPPRLPMVCFDERLSKAAVREGFTVTA